MKNIHRALAFVLADLERDVGFENSPYYLAVAAMDFAVAGMVDAEQAEAAMVAIDAEFAEMVLELAGLV